MQTVRAGLVAVMVLLPFTPALAGPVAVRFPEGLTRAFPTLSTPDGQKLAHGDLIQVLRGDRVVSRMTFRFKDGSLYDEIAVFAQRDVFTLLSYRIIQRGPAFPETLEASLDRETNSYTVRYRQDAESPEEVLSGRFTMPDDAYNGMVSLILKNLPARATETVSIVVFTPKPRAVKVALVPVGEDPVLVSDSPLPAIRYHVRPQLGLLASLLIADVPDMRIWVLPGEAPAFLRAEGPLYFMGPVWRIDPH